ncbi:hypothetical protein [Longilinea arvoryzae]|nr:hypothetical protein [Longilinea arvoryzae]
MLISTAIPAALYFPAHRFLLTPDAVTQEILASDLSAKLPDLVAGWMLNGTIQLQGGNFLGSLDREDYDAILALLAPSDWTAIQSAVIARQAQDFLMDKTDSLTITLDMTGISQRLNGDALQAVAGIIMASWNDCSAANLVELGLAAAAGNSAANLPFCRPPDALQPFMLQIVETGLQQISAQIPPSLTIEVAQAETASHRVQLIRLLARIWPWMPWLTLAIAGLIWSILRRSPRYGLLAIGLPLGLAGVIASGISVVLVSVRNSYLAPWLDGQLALRLPTDLAKVISPALVNVFSRFCLSGLIWGAAVFLLGMVLIILSRIVRQPQG